MSGQNYDLDLDFRFEQCQVIKDVFKKYNAPMCMYDDCEQEDDVEKLDRLYVSNDFLLTIKQLNDKYQQLEFAPSFAKPAGDGYAYNLKIGCVSADNVNELRVYDDEYKLYAENWTDFINNLKIIMAHDQITESFINIVEVKLIDNQLVSIVQSNEY